MFSNSHDFEMSSVRGSQKVEGSFRISAYVPWLLTETCGSPDAKKAPENQSPALVP